MRNAIGSIILAFIVVFAIGAFIYGEHLAHQPAKAPMGVPVPVQNVAPSPFFPKHKPPPNNYDNYFAVDSIPPVPILKQGFRPGYYYWIRRGQKFSDAKYCATWNDFNKLCLEVTGMPYPTEIVRTGGTPPNMFTPELFPPGKYFFPGFGQKPSDARYCMTLDDYTKIYNELNQRQTPGRVLGTVFSIFGFTIILLPLFFSFGIVSLLTIMGEMNFARGHKLFGPPGYYESLMEHRRQWFAIFAGASTIIPLGLFLIVVKISLQSLIGLVGSILALYFIYRISSTRRWKRVSHKQCPKCGRWSMFTYYGSENFWIFLRHSTPSSPSPTKPYFYDKHYYVTSGKDKGRLRKIIYYYFCSCGHNFDK